MPATYTVKQVAEILGYSTNSIYTFLKEKRIRGVRVGKGRFRIPQKELDRLLLETGKKTKQISTTASSSALSLQNPEPQRYIEDIALPPAVEVPSLLDWFAGVASMLLGFSMILFSRQFEEFAFADLGIWIRSVQVTFITCGAGLLLTDIVGKSKTVWRLIFLTFLSVGFSALSLASFLTGDQAGTWLYGLLAFFICFHLVSSVGAVASFALYAGSALGGLPLLELTTGRSLLHVVADQAGLPHPTMLAVWVGVCTTVGALLVWGAKGKKQIFWVGMTAIAGVWVGIALWWTSSLMWGKAMYSLTIALVALFVPTWDTLRFSSRQDRKLVFASFGLVLGLFLLAIAVVRLLQTNVVSYASEQLENKTQYGRIMLESRIDTIQRSLANISEDGTVSNAIVRKESDVLLAVLRGIYAGNKNIRRILAVGSSGDLIGVYPHDVTIESTNFGNREYVQKVIATKASYTADLYESQLSGPPLTLLIAVPVFHPKTGEVAGVLAAHVDLLGLSDRVQQIASSELGETFSVLNHEGRYLITPDNSLLGTQSPADHPIRSGLAGKQGVSEWYDADRNRVIGSYKPMETAPWVIAVEVPVKNILSVTGAGTVTVFGLVIVSIVIVVFLSVIRRGNTTGVPPPMRGP